MKKKEQKANSKKNLKQEKILRRTAQYITSYYPMMEMVGRRSWRVGERYIEEVAPRSSPRRSMNQRHIRSKNKIIEE